MPAAIGIDLGTTNSVVAFLEGAKVEVAPNAEGGRTTPSVVLYRGETEIIVGEMAKRQAITEPGSIVRSVKRIMGKRFEDVERDLVSLPYEVVELDDGMAGVRVGNGAVLRPEEVSADILDKLRATAEDFLGYEVPDCVITVPAHFNDQQRTATKAAAEMAGFNVLRVINEPTAAALAYGMGTVNAGGTVVVFDFGGGTFDVSVLHLAGDIFEVVSTNGDNHLGGDDVDNLLFEHLADGVAARTGVDPRDDAQAAQRLWEAAEKTKCELSSVAESAVSLPFLVADEDGPKHFEAKVTREEFNGLCEPLFQRLLEPCRRAMRDADTEPHDVDQVILVGGSTRIPRVQQLVEEFFGQKPNRQVNPDEAVAVGAAIQSGVISGALREVLLLDVTPLTLGIELAGGVFKELIPRNSTIPCEASQSFTTVIDNQAAVTVHVLQGERKIASENHSLARFKLTGIPPAPKELPEIEVKFAIDANGILTVSALDLSIGEQTGVIIENYGEIGSRRDHIERMISAGEKHLDADEDFVRFADRRTRAERVQLRASKLLERGGDSLTEDDIKRIKETVFRLDLATNAQNTTQMENLEDILEDIISEYQDRVDLSSALSELQQAASSQLPQRTPTPTGEERAMRRLADTDAREAFEQEEGDEYFGVPMTMADVEKAGGTDAVRGDGTGEAGVPPPPAAAPPPPPATTRKPPPGPAPTPSDAEAPRRKKPDGDDDDFDIDLDVGLSPPT